MSSRPSRKVAAALAARSFPVQSVGPIYPLRVPHDGNRGTTYEATPEDLRLLVSIGWLVGWKFDAAEVGQKAVNHV